MKQEDLALLTDLYALTMAQSYFQENHNDTAVFSLFIRKYPPDRGFFVSCGLEDVLSYLAGLHFSGSALDRLSRTRIFSDDFLDFLKGFRFTGHVRAIPEGRLFFVDEPILEVAAPIIEGQIVESYIINQMNLQCMIAGKAARCIHAAGGRSIIDFSLRRTHGTDAAMKVARASYMAGFDGTSNVLAGVTYGIPVSGTMAHSYINSFEQEIEAFRAYTRAFPHRSILLIETYDALSGAQKAVEVARELAARGEHLQGVRIDSGDLPALATEVRRILDQAGFPQVRIIGSGGLDEFDLDELSRTGAPFDGYGVGTKVGVSADAPWTDMAYKLVRYRDRPVMKLSTGKATLPGAKQVFRFLVDNAADHDVIGLTDEPFDTGEPLLKPVMTDGQILEPSPPLKDIRERFREEFYLLDDKYKALRSPERYPVSLSDRLRELKEGIERRVKAI